MCLDTVCTAKFLQAMHGRGFVEGADAQNKLCLEVTSEGSIKEATKTQFFKQNLVFISGTRDL